MPKRKRGDGQTAQARNETDGEDGVDQPESSRQNRATKNDNSPKLDGGVQSFTSQSNGKEIHCERRGTGKTALVFTHGAGGGLSNPATQDFANGFAEVSPIVLFQGTMNLQSRVNGFNAVIGHQETQPALGGRSMGARAAVLTAQQPQSGIKALVLASYPMIGAQKGDLREQILLDLQDDTDVLFMSGSKDTMCDMAHLHKVTQKMKARSWVVEVQGADHGMNLKPKAGVQRMTREQGVIAANWLLERDESKRHCSLSWNTAQSRVVSSGWKSSPGGPEVGSSSIKSWAKPLK